MSIAAAAVITLSFLFCADALPSIPLCPFYEFYRLPCPGCGLTRAFCCIGHGDFSAAWRFNPFSFLFYGACICLVVWPAVRRWCPDIERRVVNSPWLDRAPMILVALMLAFGAWRIALAL